MPKHRKEAVRGLRLPVVPLMGGLALAGGAALLLSGPGGTSPLASLDSATQSKTMEYDVSLVNTEFSTDVLCFGQAGCDGIGGARHLFGGGGGNSLPVGAVHLPLWCQAGPAERDCSATAPPARTLISSRTRTARYQTDATGRLVVVQATAGQNGGLLFGNGGAGGKGLAAQYVDPDGPGARFRRSSLRATNGANGGNAGFIGNGGLGGAGGAAVGSPDPGGPDRDCWRRSRGKWRRRW